MKWLLMKRSLPGDTSRTMRYRLASACWARALTGNFICDIVRDGYGFNVVDALLDSDPRAWNFTQAGELANGSVTVTYGSQTLPDRERRAFLYVRTALASDAIVPHAAPAVAS
ncbi:hypothetical protein [Burkholderia sp. F1]|uniref:hypothetical protein n=1 Tax=Burkholderia sp. F1 TaxID=3366817 RepID=UPI003D752D48